MNFEVWDDETSVGARNNDGLELSQGAAEQLQGDSDGDEDPLEYERVLTDDDVENDEEEAEVPIIDPIARDTLPNLPPVSATASFRPFVHHSPPRPLMEWKKVPEDYSANWSPLKYFLLFWPVTLFEMLAEHTNKYADMQDAQNPEKRNWKPVGVGELIIWFGLVGYMGAVGQRGSYRKYWRRDKLGGYHEAMRGMGQRRFEQIKRYFHIADPTITLTPNDWFKKLGPLMNSVGNNWREWVIPGTDCAIDESMVRFRGRSAPTQRVKSKPTKEGFKIFLLCQGGFTYAKLWTSRVTHIVGLTSRDTQREYNLNETDSAVFHLASLFPSRTFSFNLFLDNYFSNIPLLQALRDIDIGATGTTRPKSTEYPSVFRFRVKTTMFRIGTLSAIQVHDVLSILLQDKSLVRIITPISLLVSDPACPWESFWDVDRGRPRLTKSNQRLVKDGWGDEAHKPMKMPRAVVEYSQFMGAVDVQNQLRESHETSFRYKRTWLPLAMWIYDTNADNAWLTARRFGNLRVNQDLQEWWLNLAHDMIQFGSNMAAEQLAAERELDDYLTELDVNVLNPQLQESPVRKPGQFRRGHKSQNNHSYVWASAIRVVKLSGLPSGRLRIKNVHRLVKLTGNPLECLLCCWLFKGEVGVVRRSEIVELGVFPHHVAQPKVRK